MLAIRMQRVGRKGYAQFRVIVQDSHRSPSAGKVVAFLGSYNPHTKEAKLDKDEIEKFLNNGAQPSNRVAILLKKEGIKLPKWVVIDESGKRKLKNAEKLRKNQPKDAKPAPKKEEAEAEVEEAKEEVAEAVVEEAKEEVVEAVVEEAKEEVKEAAEEVVAEEVTEEVKEEVKEAAKETPAKEKTKK